MAATRLNPRTPGVYIEEISVFPPSVAQVETAIPVFIGYTERATGDMGDSLNLVPKRISSMFEFERYFGRPQPETAITVTVTNNANGTTSVTGGIAAATRSPYLMFYAVQWFYTNGGGDCWVVSVDDYVTGAGTVAYPSLKLGLDETDRVDEITLLLFPDAVNLSTPQDYYQIHKDAIDKCVDLQDRFVIMDVWQDPANPAADNVLTLRNEMNYNTDRLKYAAAYFPPIRTTLDFVYYTGAVNDGNGDANVQVVGGPGPTLADLASLDNALYNKAKTAIRDIPMLLSPSPAIAGIYARVDGSRGVWKAPANEGLNAVFEPSIKITDHEQESLNVDTTAGKSINAIRSFTGRGTLVWGARTLAGNDNEWRYVNVRRYFNMVEESVKKATEPFVFEPNDRNTWTRIKAMIENFLTTQWGAGALQGKIPAHAFYVKVGLGETMSALDILEGRLIVEVGMAVVRPAEFIILQFMHKLPES